MREALTVAQRGMLAGEPPVGACVVQNGRIIASAHTGVIQGPDATAHAEIRALRAACQHARSPWLADAALYVTVEPCAMCLAASHYAGLTHIFFGVELGVLQAVTGRELAGVRPGGLAVTGGLLAEECAALVRTWAQNAAGPGGRARSPRPGFR